MGVCHPPICYSDKKLFYLIKNSKVKNKIAKYLLFATLAMVVVSYLPWIYMTATYYILRYAIMACMGCAFLLSLSIEKYCSIRFVRLFFATIVIVALEFITFILLGRHFMMSDLTQLTIAFLSICIGISLDTNIREWANICYYYTIGVIIMTIINCFFWAGDLVVPEFYMLDEGKNQIGGLLAIAGAAMYFFAIKIKEQRTHFLILFVLSLLVLVLIRARSDCFALVACFIFITIKDCDWKFKWSAKTIITILGVLLIGYIVYVGFIGDELTRFMIGGKSSSNIDVLTSNRLERNHKAIEFLQRESFMGEQEEDSGILLIHNYMLLRLVRYGIGALPLIAFYIYFGIFTLCNLFKKRKTDIRDAGYIVCTIPLIVSFAEPSYPYGPGSVQLIAYLLLGATFRSHLNSPLPRTEHGKVLHICNDFANSKVHSELYKQLDNQGVEQIVYCPIRNKKLEGQNYFDGEHTQIIYSYILRPLHRIFFNAKIDKISKDISKQIDLSQISYVHATNLFSDGAVALHLKRKYGIPYIVAVRNTDMNAFLKYMPHLWWVHREVIREADKIISITPMLQRRINSHISLIGMRNLAKEKNIVISNGLNAFWLNNISAQTKQNAHNICYAGNFDSNKNVMRLIDAVLSLKTEFADIHLDLAGSNGEQEKDILDMAKKHPDVIEYHGRITDKNIMKNFYSNNNVFAMPSNHETFGLVYVEAMSQGLSILYTKNEGIDGFFEENIGESVNPQSVESITNALRNLLAHPDNYDHIAKEKFCEFDWTQIAKKYQKLYKI